MSFKQTFLLLCLIGVSALSCKSTKSESVETDESVMPSVFQSRVLVSLMPDANTTTLESDFSKYELKHLSIASKSKNQHLFEFNMEKISTEKILRKLNRSNDVYFAEALAAHMNETKRMSSDEKKQIDIK